MNTESEYFQGLGVILKLAGSVIEDTKVGQLDEADCSIFFKNLKPEYFALSNCSTKYRVTEAGQMVLHPHLVDTDGNLEYINFIEAILTDLKICLATKPLPPRMTVQLDHPSCDDCFKGDGDFDHLKHCEKCRPAVTFSQAGPCGILDDNGTIVSIDLIPLLPCPEKNPIKMFDKVTSSLVNGTFPNWFPYLQKFLKYDTFLPNVLMPDQPIFICMELLHALSDKDVYILRPGQDLNMKNLQYSKLRKLYCFLKILKNVMKVGLSSYTLKKIILQEEFTQLNQYARDVIELLHIAINHIYLHPLFWNGFVDPKNYGRREIDFDAWKKLIEDNAPSEEDRKREEEGKPWEDVHRESGYKTIPLK